MSRLVSRPWKTMTLLAALLTVSASQPGSAQEQTPPAIFHPAVPYPIWISAKAAEHESLADPTIFHPEAAQQITFILSQTPVRGCYEAGSSINDFAGGRRSPSSLEEAARSYPVFAWGVVRELTPGFLVGEPGQLARVIVTEGSRGVALSQEFFVFIPVGTFTFLGKKICKEDTRFAGVPAVGDELLVFVDEATTKDVIYFGIDYPEAVVLISSGKVRLAPRLLAALSSSLEASAIPASREDLLALLPVLRATPFEGEEP